MWSKAEFIEEAEGFSFRDFADQTEEGAAQRASLAKAERSTDIQYADLLKFIEAFNEVVAHMEYSVFLLAPDC